jgi:hypothetical protein
MKILYTIIILFLPILSFSQTPEYLKEYVKEMTRLKIDNSKLKLDTSDLKFKIGDANRKLVYQINKDRWVIDSMRWVIVRLQREKDSLESFKRQIFNLTGQSVLLYQRDNVCKRCDPNDIFYITLNGFEIIMKSNDVVILKPIKDKNMWKKPKIYGYPYPENIGLHLYPYTNSPTNYDYNKLK